MKHENNGLVPSDCFMSRRDQIATQALAGIVAGAVANGETWTAEAVSQAAIECADALLLKLDKKNPGQG